MKRIMMIGLSFMLMLSSCDELSLLEPIEEGLSNDDIVAGLKEALEVGTDTSVAKLNVTDGYFKDAAVKILLPEEAQPVYDRLNSIPGISTLLDETILSINRAAEDAAIEAKPIFVSAITGMTIDDGLGILFGDDTAATAYLRTNTNDSLFAAFQPRIENSLSKDLIGNLSAEELYSRLINTYNDASLNGFLWDKINSNSLSEHTTRRALRGLFMKVGEQETDIRENPVERVTDLLEEVFALQDEEQQ